MIKRLLLVVLVLVLGIAGYYWYMFSRKGKDNNDGQKQAPIALKKHSEAFNKSITAAMNAYFDMKNGFVEADTIAVATATKKFIQLLDSIPLTELKKDTLTIYETALANLNDIKLNAASLLKQPNITEMRHDFSTVSELLYPSFFKTINYEGDKMYWENCPMAFGEDKGANWISNTDEIINPYLGKQHPEYHATMLHCGEVKDTIKAQ